MPYTYIRKTVKIILEQICLQVHWNTIELKHPRIDENRSLTYEY